MRRAQIAAQLSMALSMGIFSSMVSAANTAAAQVPVTNPTHKSCDQCDDWNGQQEPFRLFGESYYVGTRGLSAVLIHTAQGLVLFDGGLPQSADRIESNIRALGFEPKNVKWIFNSHAHFDHAGGLAELARRTGARVAASHAGAQALRAGDVSKGDPQAAFGEWNRFPKLSKVQALRDGETITLGEVVITAHDTPGHAPGSMSYSWRACEDEHCVDVVYADSLNAVSADDFKFTADTVNGVSKTVQGFRTSIDKVEKLPCDLIVSVHPDNSGLFEKLAARQKWEQAGKPKSQTNPLIDKKSCQRYAANARERLNKRVEEELKTAE